MQQTLQGLSCLTHAAEPSTLRGALRGNARFNRCADCSLRPRATPGPRLDRHRGRAAPAARHVRLRQLRPRPPPLAAAVVRVAIGAELGVQRAAGGLAAAGVRPAAQLGRGARALALNQLARVEHALARRPRLGVPWGGRARRAVPLRGRAPLVVGAARRTLAAAAALAVLSRPPGGLRAMSTLRTGSPARGL